MGVTYYLARSMAFPEFLVEIEATAAR